MSTLLLHDAATIILEWLKSDMSLVTTDGVTQCHGASVYLRKMPESPHAVIGMFVEASRGLSRQLDGRYYNEWPGLAFMSRGAPGDWDGPRNRLIKIELSLAKIHNHTLQYGGRTYRLNACHRQSGLLEVSAADRLNRSMWSFNSITHIEDIT